MTRGMARGGVGGFDPPGVPDPGSVGGEGGDDPPEVQLGAVAVLMFEGGLLQLPLHALMT